MTKFNENFEFEYRETSTLKAVVSFFGPSRLRKMIQRKDCPLESSTTSMRISIETVVKKINLLFTDNIQFEVSV